MELLVTDIASLDVKLAKLVAGNCGVLALNIHRLTGWQIVALCDATAEISVLDQNYSEIGKLPGPIKHAYVRPPEGGCLDGHGYASSPRIEAFFIEEPCDQDISAETIIALIDARQLGDDQRIRQFTRQAAETLVELTKRGDYFSADQLLRADLS